MPISIPLVNAARKLIDTFGNNASLYSYSGATKTTNDEGEDSVSNWGTATTIKVVDANQGQQVVQAMHGAEVMGEDEKIIRDSVTIALNDRLTYDSKNYRVTAIRKVFIESTLIIQIINVSEQASTARW